MKKYLIIIFLLIVSIMCSCNSNGSLGTTPESLPVSSPPQPIQFNSFDEAVSFIRKNDCTAYEKYPEGHLKAYENMLGMFLKDGFVTKVISEDAEPVYGVSLYPEAKREDVGIACWLKWNNVDYQVLVYNTKAGEAYKIDMENQNYTDYCAKRFGKTGSYKTIENSEHEIFKTLYIGLRNNKNCAYSMIDETHYIVVNAGVEESTLIDFINTLIITEEKIA